MKLNIKSLFSKKYMKWWISLLIVVVIAVPAILIPVTLLVNKRDFVLANYKSYMNPQVEHTLRKKYKLSFDAFENAEDAKKLVKQNAADIVNTTSYELVDWIQEGLVKKIEWTNFKIPYIQNANDALNLFTQPVKAILTGYDINHNNIFYPNDKDDNLLNYGIPYFIQDLVFCYRGNKINNLNQSMNWKTLINNISSTDSFKFKNKPKIAALNDARTIYSIPRLMQTNNSINPENNATLEQLNQTFTYLSNSLSKLGEVPITFSDSNSVLNQLACNDVKGAIMFNGDAIFSSFGGDQGYEINDFNFIKPKETLIALDLFTINNKIENENLNKSYEVLNDLCLSFNKANYEDYLSFQNFDYVNYTTPLKSMYDFLTNPNTKYFDPLQIQLFKISNTKQYEKPISNITKSNLSFSWINFTSNL